MSTIVDKFRHLFGAKEPPPTADPVGFGNDVLFPPKSEDDVKHFLGHSFRPFSDLDWHGFAGAKGGSYICYCEDGTTLILAPNGIITEILPYEEDDTTSPWREWTVTGEDIHR